MTPNPAVNTDAHRRGFATRRARRLPYSFGLIGSLLMRRPMVLLRYTWASPATAVGLLFSIFAVVAGARPRLVDGVLEVGGGHLSHLMALLPRCAGFAAITFGHVIIGLDHSLLRRVRAHELIHVRQYERWGVLFFPLYVTSSLVAFLCGRDPYWDNAFEREAYAKTSACPEA
jgi:hypothetical protein